MYGFKTIVPTSLLLLLSAVTAPIAAVPVNDAIPDRNNHSWDKDRCYFSTALPSFQWAVTVTHDSDREKGGCGAGLLDNIRGRCGAITTWHCDRVGDKGAHTALATFWTSTFCTAYAVTEAIKASSAGQINVPCVDITEPSGPEISDLFPETIKSL